MYDCIKDLKEWMTRDQLKLKDDKTEFLLIGIKQQLEKDSFLSVKKWYHLTRQQFLLILTPRLCTQDGKTIPHLKENKLSTKYHIYLKKVNIFILVNKYSTNLHKLSTKTKLNWVRDMILLNKKEMTQKQNVLHHIQKTSSKFG